MNIYATPNPITAQQIRALKGAQRMCFITRGGRTYIRAIREVEMHGFKTEADCEIDCHMQSTIYGGDQTGHYQHRHDITNAFAYLGVCKYDPCWQTTIKHLKVGDSLTLRWTADNNTGTLIDAGLHCDTLELLVRRTSKTGKHFIFTYHIDTSICPDNTARMIRGFSTRQAA